MSGTQDVVIAGGVQDHDADPIGSAMVCAKPLGFTTRSGQQGLGRALRPTSRLSQFHGAQLMAKRWNISRLEWSSSRWGATGARAARSRRPFDRELIETSAQAG